MAESARDAMAASLQGKASGSGDKPPEGGDGKKRPDKSARLQKVPDLDFMDDLGDDEDKKKKAKDGLDLGDLNDDDKDDDEAEKPKGNKRPDPAPKEGAPGSQSTPDEPSEGYAGSDYTSDNIETLCDLFDVDPAIYSGDGDRLKEVVKKAKALPIKKLNLEQLKHFVNLAFRAVVDKVMGGKSEATFDLSAKNLLSLLKMAEDRGVAEGKKQAPPPEPANPQAIAAARDEGFLNGQDELLETFCGLIGESLDTLVDDEGNKPQDATGRALVIKQRLRKRLGLDKDDKTSKDADEPKDDKSEGKPEGTGGFLKEMLKGFIGQ